MEAANTFETCVDFCETIRHNNTEHDQLHNRRLENLKTHNSLSCFCQVRKRAETVFSLLKFYFLFAFPVSVFFIAETSQIEIKMKVVRRNAGVHKYVWCFKRILVTVKKMNIKIST
jgi:hypothetical protein